MDEAATALHKDVYPPQPVQPGSDPKEDYHDEHEGVERCSYSLIRFEAGHG